MKYSNYLGIFGAVTIIAACFLPWSYIPSINTTLTGMNTAPTNFGKPGLLNIILSTIAILCFVIPAIIAKRINLFICAFNFAWSIRTFILLSQCEFGECPEKKAALYIVLLLSAIILVMTLFPMVKEKENN